MTMADQQTAAPVQQTAAAIRPMAPPRFNYRVAAGFEAYQAKNIETLRKRMGSSDTGVLRVAIDVLAYLSGLPVATDPSIYLNNFLINSQNQNGGHDGR